MGAQPTARRHVPGASPQRSAEGHGSGSPKTLPDARVPATRLCKMCCKALLGSRRASPSKRGRSAKLKNELLKQQLAEEEAALEAVLPVADPEDVFRRRRLLTWRFRGSYK